MTRLHQNPEKKLIQVVKYDLDAEMPTPTRVTLQLPLVVASEKVIGYGGGIVTLFKGKKLLDLNEAAVEAIPETLPAFYPEHHMLSRLTTRTSR